MAEQVQARVEKAISDCVTELDTQYIRKMQGDMYRCSARCCDNTSSNMEEAQRCIERCSQPLQRAQNTIQTELQDYQERLQRCAVQCQDDVKDRLSPGASSQQIDALRGEMESCLVKCGDKHIAILPAMMKRMKSTLSQYQ
ncbi:protein FAM136A-like [Anneissia japonica]|uniref:protein FAM136A-like n=1 Tax=Anneissia japonica TaxID=1529436 RepID=UPI00142579AE|nr:protein FAM136A-like [Anneissia japonica]